MANWHPIEGNRTQKGNFQGEGKGLLNVPPSDPPQVELNDNFSDIFFHL